MKYHTVFLAGLVLLLGFSSGCRSIVGDPLSSETDIDFSLPEDLPDAVAREVERIVDTREPMVSRIDHEGEIYVAVARGEVAHPGHGVAIDRITCLDEDGEMTVTVEARYTAPEAGMHYPQVIAYPVVVGSFSVDDLPRSEIDDVRVVFLVDESVAESPVEDTEIQTHNIVLYFATEDGWLERDIRSIRAEELTLDIVAAEIAIGPEVAYLQPILPEGTSLRVTRDEDDPSLAIVDFTEEIRGVQGSLDEMIALYGVVNTLVENDLGISRVMVLVSGKSIDSLGHVDLTDSLTYDESVVRESK